MKESGVLVQFPVKYNPVASVVNPTSETDTRVFRIKTANIVPIKHPEDGEQYDITATAFTIAGMSYEPIINNAEEKGEEVIRAEVDAPLRQGLENKKNEIIRQGNTFRGWQRGEEIVINKLPTGVETQPNVIPFQSNAVSDPNQASLPEKRDVIEVIGISPFQPTQLPQDSSFDSQRIGNPYLNSPVKIQSLRENKKAA